MVFRYIGCLAVVQFSIFILPYLSLRGEYYKSNPTGHFYLNSPPRCTKVHHRVIFEGDIDGGEQFNVAAISQRRISI